MTHLSIYLLLSTVMFGLLTVMLNSTNIVGMLLKGLSFLLTLMGLVELLMNLGILLAGPIKLV